MGKDLMSFEIGETVVTRRIRNRGLSVKLLAGAALWVVPPAVQFSFSC
jgi:hypothetical protein